MTTNHNDDDEDLDDECSSCGTHARHAQPWRLRVSPSTGPRCCGWRMRCQRTQPWQRTSGTWAWTTQQSPQSIAAARAPLLAEIEALRKRAEDAERALGLAKVSIVADREALFLCHVNPVTGTVDDEHGQDGLSDYDTTLAAIDAAIKGTAA